MRCVRVLVAVLVLALLPAAPAAARSGGDDRPAGAETANKKKPKKKARKRRKRQAVLPAIVDVPVRFTVRNTNTSRVPCAADGGTYEVAGSLVGPRGVLAGAGPKAVTLYVHGLSYGEFFWRFQDVPGYDYARLQAETGHVSVAIDRLGYGASGRPDGNQLCFGSEADYLHQIVDQLRSGSYTATGDPAAPARFDRVALAGHSAGGFMVEGEAISFGGIDALVLLGFANTGAGPATFATFAETQLTCNLAPMPGNYAYFGQTEADFRRMHLHNTDPAVADAAARRRTADPCGDTSSALQSIVVDVLSGSSIDVPVLVAAGANDAIFPPPAADEERLVLFANDDVTAVTVPDTGHAVTLGRTAPQVRRLIGDWLSKRGF